MNSGERIALFIDGANLHATAKSLGFDVDYRRLLKEFQSRGNLLRAYYYTALVEDQEYSSIRPLIDWLDYNGFRVVTKPAKEYVDSTGRRKMKGNMDIELAIDALELAPFINHAVIFSGDGDFRSLVEALQRKGLKVSCCFEPSIRSRLWWPMNCVVRLMISSISSISCQRSGVIRVKRLNAHRAKSVPRARRMPLNPLTFEFCYELI